jgi:very-short-patch-repair endonuclease
MRKNPTDAERRLWRHLSGKKLGVRFRRQHPMGAQYIADFICLEKKLIIELDGSQHAEQKKIYDEKRTQFLDKEGYRVLRFWNNEVLAETQNVCEMILQALEFTPHDSPSAHLLPPKGGAEGAAHA